jgi:hypothetical protein
MLRPAFSIPNPLALPPLPAGGLLDRNDVNPVLNGTLPGDYGYDPLNLAKDPETLAKYRANELLHARWAMLAAAGAIIPEGLAANGADVKGATWFETGAAMLNGGTLNWFAVPIANVSNPLPLFAVVAVNTALMAAVENYRRVGEWCHERCVRVFGGACVCTCCWLWPSVLTAWIVCVCIKGRAPG